MWDDTNAGWHGHGNFLDRRHISRASVGRKKSESQSRQLGAELQIAADVTASGVQVVGVAFNVRVEPSWISSGNLVFFMTRMGDLSAKLRTSHPDRCNLSMFTVILKYFYGGPAHFMWMPVYPWSSVDLSQISRRMNFFPPSLLISQASSPTSSRYPIKDIWKILTSQRSW